MTLPPLTPWGGAERSDRPDAPLQTRLTQEERRQHLEVHAARWRAVELAVAAFGRATSGPLIGVRPGGSPRGLLRLRVPFAGLEEHRERELRFLAMASRDPLLSTVPLVCDFAPDGA